MKTRRGACYACPAEVHRRKRRRTAAAAAAEGPSPASSAAGCAGGGLVGDDLFEELPNDLVVSILRDVAASARSPADLASAMLTCKRFRELGQSKVVLARASPRCVAVRAKAWSDDAHRFLQRCADAGNLEACYLLGMIRFYCLGSRGSGASLMAVAAVGGHREALYSLAVVHFNGSGGGKEDRDLRAGAALCAHAAALGHVAALRELGHCLQDGYGVRRSVPHGRRLLIHANARELAAAWTPAPKAAARRHSCLLSDYGCRAAAAAAEAHAANRFLVEWFASRPPPPPQGGAKGGGEAEGEGEEGEALRLCSQALCGRPETRRHEFRRCSVCGVVNYCSRACQALHWKAAHKAECAPMDRPAQLPANAGAAAAAPAP
ncbi:hypothetical protein U9M48_032232 [Paspalum notatum var. saurae]|uniref:MYND-type domain-containing protein n=1 Tax=Paspalum notatum var. saurae TaxID=547442 RepID=A0AAQ3X4K5_PASNO